MSLLRRIEQKGKDNQPKKSSESESSSAQTSPESEPPAKNNAFIDLKQRLKSRILPKVDNTADVHSPEIRGKVEELFNANLTEDNILLSRAEKARLFEAILAEINGFGPLDALLNDDSIIDIEVNGPKNIYINQKGYLKRSNVIFDDAEHVMRILGRILESINRKIDATQPIINARLPDGSHLYAVLPPIARGGATLTIRKFSQRRLTVEDLIRFGSMTAELAEFLRACVIGHLNIVVSGSVSAGKTSLLNVLTNFILQDERIFVIENESELQLTQQHVIYWDSRASDLSTHAETNTGALVVQALKMHPDRIVVGECSGGEVRDLIQAMHLGYDGFLTTMYSENPKDTLTRLETMFLISGTQLSTAAIRSQLASSIDLIVHLERLRDGSRKITRVTEVQGMDGELISLSDIFEFEQTNVQAGKVIGRLRPTGLRPKFIDRVESAGIHLPPTTFGIGRSVVEERPTTEPQSEAPAVENVQFTMFHPKEAAAEKWYTALVYAHITTALEAVQKDAKKFDDEMAQDVRELHSKQAAKLARGTELRLIPEAEGIEFKPAMLTLKWDEDIERANFRFRANSDLIGQPAFGEMAIYVGPVQVASIRFSIFIGDSETATHAKVEQVAAKAELYHNVFVSYSHRDTSIVEACTQAFRAIGYEVLVDYEKLRSGEEWGDTLKKMIDQADIFQLFWSQNSAASQHVSQEWQYALAGTSTDKNKGFIRPVYWEQPMPDVPPELAHLHFKFLPSLASTNQKSASE